MSSPNRIDVHHHFVPSVFKEILSKSGSKEWPAIDWSASSSQAISRDRGIGTAILSLTTPAASIADSLSDQLAIARDANDTAAKVRDDDPSHFGFFSTIPDPVKYPKESLSELARAFDDLHADGVCLMTSYSGKYLGDAAFSPLWTELNRRKALVFIHPTSPPGDYRPVNKILLPPVMDFTFETTKTACDLILSGTTLSNPDVKIILSHGGGNLPWIWHRVAQLPKHMHLAEMSYDTFLDQARSFYFDTALTGYPDNVRLLLKFAKPGHVLYGSDFPYAPNPCIEDMTNGLDEVLDQEGNAGVREAVNWRSALELFPRLNEFRRGEGSRL